MVVSTEEEVQNGSIKTQERDACIPNRSMVFCAKICLRGGQRQLLQIVITAFSFLIK